LTQEGKVADMIRTLCGGILGLCIALWLGGVVGVMWSVQALFHADRGVAVVAAPIMFRAFGTYHLVVAVVAAGAALVAWKGRRWMPALLLVGLVLAGVSALYVTPHVDALRAMGGGGSAEFKAWHGISMMLYCTEAGLIGILAVAAGVTDSAGRRLGGV
jgi:hypothetical protein